MQFYDPILIEKLEYLYFLNDFVTLQDKLMLIIIELVQKIV